MSFQAGAWWCCALPPAFHWNRSNLNTIPLRQKRILLVDDEPGVRKAIALLLSLDEHQVTEAADGAQALELFAPERFDLVITDLTMPEVRGDELACRIRHLAPRQAIVMITAYQPQRGPLNPVDAILQKPPSLAELRREIAAALSRPHESN